MKIRRIVSVLLLCVMFMTFSLDLIEAATVDETSDKVVYEYNDYTVEYSIVNQWEENYIAEVVLTNTGKDVLYNWALRFELYDNINEVWGGSIYSRDKDIYTIKCCDYNANIEPGESVSWRFQAMSENKIEIPDTFKIPVANVEAASDDYSIWMQTKSDFETEIYIKNLSEHSIFGWNIEFITDAIITKCANGELENYYNGVVIRSYEYNNEIKPYETICVTLYTEKNSICNEISDIILYERRIVDISAYENINFESIIDIEASMNFISSEQNHTEYNNEEEYITVKIKPSEEVRLNDTYNYIGFVEIIHKDKVTEVKVSGDMLLNSEGIIGSLYGDIEGIPVAVTINYAFQNKEPYAFLAVGSLDSDEDYYKVFGKRQKTNDIISDKFVTMNEEYNESSTEGEPEPLMLEEKRV